MDQKLFASLFRCMEAVTFLLQILEGLSFLHNDVKLVHGNIQPSSIMLNDLKTWKLSGFDFFVPNTSQMGDEVGIGRCSSGRECITGRGGKRLISCSSWILIYRTSYVKSH